MKINYKSNLHIVHFESKNKWRKMYENKEIPDTTMPMMIGKVYKTAASGELDSSRSWNACRDERKLEEKSDALWINIENGENEFSCDMAIFYEQDYLSRACKYDIVQIEDVENIRSYKLGIIKGKEHKQELGPEDYNESLKEGREQELKRFEDEENELDDR